MSVKHVLSIAVVAVVAVAIAKRLPIVGPMLA
jgi:hypothetical protein